jgi:hypothetical protein
MTGLWRTTGGGRGVATPGSASFERDGFARAGGAGGGARTGSGSGRRSGSGAGSGNVSTTKGAGGSSSTWPSASAQSASHAATEPVRRPTSPKSPAELAEKAALSTPAAKVTPNAAAIATISGSHAVIPAAAATSRTNQACFPESPRQASFSGYVVWGRRRAPS